MPLTSEAVLKQLVEATAEAKLTVSNLHAARATAMDVIKSQKAAIADSIAKEVQRVVEDLSEDARDRMRWAVDQVIEKMAEDLRAALKLDAP